MQLACAVAAGRQAEITPAFDVWQLGLLVYEALSGCPYWTRHSNDSDILSTLQEPTAPLPHESNPVVTIVFQGLLARCLERDPAKRITAHELEAALRAEVSRDVPNRTLNGGTVTTEITVQLTARC